MVIKHIQEWPQNNPAEAAAQPPARSPAPASSLQNLITADEPPMSLEVPRPTDTSKLIKPINAKLAAARHQVVAGPPKGGQGAGPSKGRRLVAYIHRGAPVYKGRGRVAQHTTSRNERSGGNGVHRSAPVIITTVEIRCKTVVLGAFITGGRAAQISKIPVFHQRLSNTRVFTPPNTIFSKVQLVQKELRVANRPKESKGNQAKACQEACNHSLCTRKSRELARRLAQQDSHFAFFPKVVLCRGVLRTARLHWLQRNYQRAARTCCM